MTILTILFALLVSGLGYVGAQPSDVAGGGPVSHAHSSHGIGGITVDDVYGGGPTT